MDGRLLDIDETGTLSPQDSDVACCFFWWTNKLGVWLV